MMRILLLFMLIGLEQKQKKNDVNNALKLFVFSRDQATD